MVRKHLPGELDNIFYASVISRYQGKWVLCYHRERRWWEFPGGHVEPGETALQAAKRELWEETGAVDFDIWPIWDHEHLNPDGTVFNNGRTYFAEIRAFEPLPAFSEMERIGFFDELPQEVNGRAAMQQTLNFADRWYRALTE